MNAFTSIPIRKGYFVQFPKIRDFFLLDKNDNLRNFTSTNINDPEYIYVFSEDIYHNVHENIYKKRYFLSNYDFVKVKENNSDIYLNFIIPKAKFNLGNRNDRLLTEIKNKPSYVKEIYARTKIDFSNKNQNQIILKESIYVLKKKNSMIKFLL